MKRIIIIIAASLVFLFLCGTVGIYFLIGHKVQQNIEIAKSKYPGTAEEALIAFLLDTNNSPIERTHIAIWSLGQIESKKAIPVLKELYKGDPEGKTCYGKHSSVICQYEIYKALHARDINWWPLHPGLNK